MLAHSYAQFVQLNDPPPSMPSTPRRIIVLCDGTQEGDDACLLAADIAHTTGASVHAVALLDLSKITRTEVVSSDDPVITILSDVSQQLYRTVGMPGYWRLNLLVGRLAEQLGRACRDQEADLLMLPEAFCSPDDVRGIGTYTTIPIMCVRPSGKTETRRQAPLPQYEGRELGSQEQVVVREVGP